MLDTHIRAEIKFSIIILLIFFFQPLFCQINTNLIFNGGFEDLNIFKKSFYVANQPTDNIGVLNDTSFFWGNAIKRKHPISAAYWNGTTDNIPKFNAYYSDSIFHDAHNGNCFGVVELFQQNKTEYYTNSLIAKIIQPLIKNHTYKVSFFAKPYKGNMIVNAINIALDKKIMNELFTIDNGKKDIRFLPLQLAEQINSPIFKSTDYTLYEYTYQATGGESYLYIGNFTNIQQSKNSKKTKPFGVQNISSTVNKYCIYYIDDVELVDLTIDSNFVHFDDYAKPNIMFENILQPYLDTATIFFDNNSFEINLADTTILNKVVDFLNQSDSYFIKIYGYTNEIGNDIDNFELAKKRVSVIADYISMKKIPLYKMQFFPIGVLHNNDPPEFKRKVIILINKTK